MRQYPIFTRLASDARKGPATCGGRDRLTQTIYVGTSSRNSHEFASITVQRYVDADGRAMFGLFVDDSLVKRGTLSGKDYMPLRVGE